MSEVLLVKYGGTSVRDAYHINQVAKRIAGEAEKRSVLVVVSAMAGFTDYLKEMAEHFYQHPSVEKDYILSTGEEATAALLSLALKSLGVRVKLFYPDMINLVVSGGASNGKLIGVNVDRLTSALQNSVVVVPGFFAVRADGYRITLGRGSSDLIAIFLAHCLAKAGFDNIDVRIRTDVDGIYTFPPELEFAKKVDELFHEEVTELARYGAKVMQYEAARFAMEKKVDYWVEASHINVRGSKVHDDVERKARVIAVTRQRVALVEDESGVRVVPRAMLREVLEEGNVGWRRVETEYERVSVVGYDIQKLSVVDDVVKIAAYLAARNVETARHRISFVVHSFKVTEAMNRLNALVMN